MRSSLYLSVCLSACLPAYLWEGGRRVASRREVGMGGQEEEGGRAHQKSRGDARLDSLDDGGRSFARSLGGSIGRLASEGIFGSLPISLARSLSCPQSLALSLPVLPSGPSGTSSSKI